MVAFILFSACKRNTAASGTDGLRIPACVEVVLRLRKPKLGYEGAEEYSSFSEKSCAEEVAEINSGRDSSHNVDSLLACSAEIFSLRTSVGAVSRYAQAKVPDLPFPAVSCEMNIFCENDDEDVPLQCMTTTLSLV